MSLFIKHHSYNGKVYKFSLTGERQAKCPKWDPTEEANPPLSASAALAKATEFIATIKTDDTLFWEFDGLALVNFEGWLWQARYQLTKKHGAMTGAWPQMECWILMDGTIVQPKIVEETK